MLFVKKTDWADAPSTSSPITATELTRMENGIEEGARDATELAPGNVELATATEMNTGTDLARVPSVKRVADYITAVLATAAYATQAYVLSAIAAPFTIIASAASVVPLTVKAFTTQTGNLFQAQTNAGVNLASINSNGQITAGGDFSGNAMLKALCRGVNIPGLRIQGFASQSGNLMIVQDSTGVVKVTIAPDWTINAANVGTVPGTAIKFSPTLVLNFDEDIPDDLPDETVILRRPAP